VSSDYRYAWRNGWRWAGWFVRRRHIVGVLRTLWWAYVRGHISETCQDCGRPYLLWHADDDLYGRVTGRWPTPWGDGSGRSEAATGLFCLDCFDRMAERQGISLRWIPTQIGARGEGFSYNERCCGAVPAGTWAEDWNDPAMDVYDEPGGKP